MNAEYNDAGGSSATGGYCSSVGDADRCCYPLFSLRVSLSMTLPQTESAFGHRQCSALTMQEMLLEKYL